MKKITMKDIALKAGVSKATVSMVLNNKDEIISKETKDKIFRIVEELNYIPNGAARSLSTKKSQIIGIIIPDITNPYFSEISRAIEDAASKMNYNVILCSTDNDEKREEKYVKLLISKLVDGIIFISGGNFNKSLKILHDHEIPFIILDRDVEDENNYPGVCCLNKEGVIEGLEYLLRKGRKTIAFVTGKRDLKVSQQRIEGYMEVMNNYNMFDDKLIFEGDFTIKSGIKITEKIISQNKGVDAIFYSNDLMAIGGIKTLIRRGLKIPDDISVIGFDNINISSLIEPELTTIAQPIYDMGKRACEMLIDIINGKEIKYKIYFNTKLIIRGTA